MKFRYNCVHFWVLELYIPLWHDTHIFTFQKQQILHAFSIKVPETARDNSQKFISKCRRNSETA